MLRLIVPQFHDLLSMTRQAGVGDVGAKTDIFWCMRISVAAEAALKLVVRFFCMAHAALRNRFLDGWRVTDMAILTTDSSFVSTAFCLNICGWFCMALDTVRIQELGCFSFWGLCFRSVCSKGKTGEREQKRDECPGDQVTVNVFHCSSS